MKHKIIPTAAGIICAIAAFTSAFTEMPLDPFTVWMFLAALFFYVADVQP